MGRSFFYDRQDREDSELGVPFSQGGIYQKESENHSHAATHASWQFLEVRHLCPMTLLNKDDIPHFPNEYTQ